MAFGLDERYESTLRYDFSAGNYQPESQEEKVERQMNVACECWFTSKGRTIPRLVKFMDEEGRLRVLKDIKINYLEEKHYSGFRAVEYDCESAYQGQLRKFKLYFYMGRCQWAMRFVG